LKGNVNYLAHAWISRDFGHFMLGQLLGDFAVNGVLMDRHADLVRGVKAHRALDAYTDAHPAFQAGSRLLQSGCSRYAPVVMDVVMDHALVRNWQALNAGGRFEDFLVEMYGSLRQIGQDLPERMRQPAARMHQMDWFSDFAQPQAMQRVFWFMSRRVRQPNYLETASQTIEYNWSELEELSLELLAEPDLMGFSADRFGEI
jgi:acyl carrier protein phosphodiesterase